MTHSFGSNPQSVFAHSGKDLRLSSLFGFPCEYFGEDARLDRTRGIVVLDTDRGRLETHAMGGTVVRATPTEAAFAWEADGVRHPGSPGRCLACDFL